MEAIAIDSSVNMLSNVILSIYSSQQACTAAYSYQRTQWFISNDKAIVI